MGGADDRGKFVAQVSKACRIGKKLKGLGVRKYGTAGVMASSAAMSNAGTKNWAALVGSTSPTPGCSATTTSSSWK